MIWACFVTSLHKLFVKCGSIKLKFGPNWFINRADGAFSELWKAVLLHNQILKMHFYSSVLLNVLLLLLS